jgi:hypothetical protein
MDDEAPADTDSDACGADHHPFASGRHVRGVRQFAVPRHVRRVGPNSEDRDVRGVRYGRRRTRGSARRRDRRLASVDPSKGSTVEPASRDIHPGGRVSGALLLRPDQMLGRVAFAQKTGLVAVARALAPICAERGAKALSSALPLVVVREPVAETDRRTYELWIRSQASCDLMKLVRRDLFTSVDTQHQVPDFGRRVTQPLRQHRFASRARSRVSNSNNAMPCSATSA